jgi:glycolate oxidase FAD binding subunit
MSNLLSQDAGDSLAEQVQDAFHTETPLRIVGGGSKSSLGRPVSGALLEVTAHRGIVDYEPTELVITARAGTPLLELEAPLAESGQMLSFEPPHLGESATVGGTLACGLSGPRRPHTCAARDSTLGVKMINGRGEILQFGGQVMKNVAGYDVSRLMVGAQGTLGVLLDVSLKVLPRPACERSVFIEMSDVVAIDVMTWLTGKALPLSAACHLPATADRPGQLCLRLSGAEAAVDACIQLIRHEQAGFPVEVLAADDERAHQFWRDLRERRLDFFENHQMEEAHSLWRVSLPPATPVFWGKRRDKERSDELPGSCLIDWAGTQRWLKTSASVETVQGVIKNKGGYATLMTPEAALLPPLNPALAALHLRLKQAFDPKGIFNPGRLYEAW